MKGMKKEVRIAFVDMWEGFSPSFIMNVMGDDYLLIEDRRNPQLVFFSCFGTEHLRYTKQIKIFVNGESFIPDFNDCDYAIGTVKVDFMNRCLWVPLSFWSSDSRMGTVRPLSREDALNRRFCSFIYSQDTMGRGARLRKELCERLMVYRKVDCPGRVLHNCDPEELSQRYAKDWADSKISYCSKYKFSIAYENENLPGYITEKLTDCYLSNTVPIYCGSIGDVYPYPKESMICVDDFENVDDLLAKIKEIDTDDDAYMAMLEANPFYSQMERVDFNEKMRFFIADIIEKGRVLFDDVREHSSASRCKKMLALLNAPWYKHCRKLIDLIHAVRNELLRFKRGKSRA